MNEGSEDNDADETMEEANLDVHHVVNTPEVDSIHRFSDDDHPEAIAEASQSLLRFSVPSHAVGPDHDHAENEKHRDTHRELNERLERVIADAAIGEAAVVVHHEDALLALRAMVDVSCLDHSAFVAASEDNLRPALRGISTIFHAQPCQPANSFLYELTHLFHWQLARSDDRWRVVEETRVVIRHRPMGAPD